MSSDIITGFYIIGLIFLPPILSPLTGGVFLVLWLINKKRISGIHGVKAKRTWIFMGLYAYLISAFLLAASYGLFFYFVIHSS